MKLYLKLTMKICNNNNHLVGKVVIVTGSNTGIGYETARNLAERGAKVIMACRDRERAEIAKNQIIQETGNSDVHYRHLDLASLKSTRDFAEDILKTEVRLDILINNAGAISLGNKKTEDGLLVGMQINYFGPFLLTVLLLPLLKKSAPSRIITVSSTLHSRGKIDFENLNMEKETDSSYSDMKVYGNSKLCNILMTMELARILESTGVTANSLCPGAVATDIIKNINNPVYYYGLKITMKLFYKTAWEGAQTSIYLAVSPEVEKVSGGYFANCQQKTPSKLARDLDLAKQLWNESERLVKLK